MLYASSKAALLKEFQFLHQIPVSSHKELTFEEYRVFVSRLQDDPPLTKREIEMNHVKLSQSIEILSSSAPFSSSNMIQFQLDPELELAFKSDSKMAIVVQLKNDILTLETFKKDQNVSLQEFQQLIPENSPRFAFYVMNSKDVGKTLALLRLVFFYICPPSSSIKEKMKYSSSRAAMVSHAERILEKKLYSKHECDHASEIEADMLELEKKPVSSSKLAFKKPPKPGSATTK